MHLFTSKIVAILNNITIKQSVKLQALYLCLTSSKFDFILRFHQQACWTTVYAKDIISVSLITNTGWVVVVKGQFSSLIDLNNTLLYQLGQPIYTVYVEPNTVLNRYNK